MTSTGENLRAERERRGLSLDDLAETTKIQKRHLQAIERSDYDELPGEVFAKGYVKSYAEALGLDSARIADAYTRERQGGGEDVPPHGERRRMGSARAALARLAELGPPAGDGARARLWILAAVLAVLLIAIGAWKLWPDRRDAAAPVAPSTTGEPAATDADTGSAASSARDVSARDVSARDVSVGDDAVQDAAASDDPATENPSAPDVAPAVVDRVDPPVTKTPDPEPPVAAPREPVTSAATTGTTSTEPAPTPPAPAVRPEPTAAPSNPEPARLTVPEFGVGTDVRNRVLVGEGDVFREGQGLSFWTRIVGGARGDSIRHVWIHEGRQVASIRLRVGGSHWRTHSSKLLTDGSAGDWAVEARDGQGRVLARSTFSCLPLRTP